MDCRVCGKYSGWSNARKPSQYEAAAYDAIKSINIRDEEWLTEIRVLKKNYSAVDIWISKLLVMIDGEGHFGIDMHGIPVHVQKDIDGRFNAAALRSNFCVLRLHYKDGPSFASAIYSALSKSRMSDKPFLQYSAYYHKLGLVTCES